MIEIRNVTVTLGGRNLLDDVSTTCHPGSLTALVGPNGAGKSTLLAVIAGDRTSYRGTVKLHGKDVTRHSVRDLAQIRSVFPQGSVIRFGYTVEEVIAMGRAFRDLPPGGDDEAVLDAMISTEVEHMAFRNAQTLSGGEQARTTFARVVVQATPIVLLDEPTAALDLRHQERVLARARDMARTGATVVAVLHDLNLAAAYADKVVLLANGKVAADGDPWEVLTQDLIERVYRQAVRILEHPVRGCPVVLTT
ncbi:iron complex transport system ATP-binding protein [Mesorhizobium sp. J18]|uniref:heme ABC transporter ATP-binding protein n=1 Tax=Mesorhizobium sp. J18 TaxID=935263 RepID=UPI00119C77F2|nr:heme ABC transporter ATP-binding protein [Mesorhizobium sp. J18]TWG97292.1 iron complex transport system ATP-binding protein [Mesorhizobium sp. J18]